MPSGSAGYGNPIGNIMDMGGAKIYLSPATDLQEAFDANGTIAELFHLAGSKKYYGDRPTRLVLYLDMRHWEMRD